MEDEALMQLVEVLEYFMPIRELAGMEEITWRTAWLVSRDAMIFGAIGWLVAWWWERRGLKKLAAVEALYTDIIIEAGPRRLDDPLALSTRSDTLQGSIVISHDYFRSFLIFLVRLVGGRISHYERLFERARREAIVRLKEQAAANGITRIINLKVVPAQIKRNGPATVEVLVYGTGVYDRKGT